jgi:hypothetical protein
MTAPPTPDEVRRVALDMLEHAYRQVPPDLEGLVQAIAAALSTTAAQAEARGMRNVVLTREMYEAGRAQLHMGNGFAAAFAAAILASGLQTTPPAAPAEGDER